MTILILDGNENQAVACVRSLARAGHKAVVGSSSSWSKAGCSRHCHATFRYHPPHKDMHAFVRSVVDEAARRSPALVMPMTERTMLPLSAARDAVASAGGSLVLPEHEVVAKACDKHRMTRLAQSLGVAVPQSIFIGDDQTAHHYSKQLPYPVVLKPSASQQVDRRAIYATGPPLYARTPEEFETAYAEIRQRCQFILAQEFVDGDGAGYFALMRHGQLLAEFSHRRLRDVRPTGSGSSLRISTLPDPRVRDAAGAILTALKWHGVAMVEFRIRPDGTPVFLEVNARFWNSLPLAVYAGADFPAWLAELAPKPPYQPGVRCRWLLGDFRHLLSVLRGRPEGYPGPFPKRLATLARFLWPVPGTYHDNLTLGDPLPELGDWLDFFGRRVIQRLRSKLADHQHHALPGNCPSSQHPLGR